MIAATVVPRTTLYIRRTIPNIEMEKDGGGTKTYQRAEDAEARTSSFLSSNHVCRLHSALGCLFLGQCCQLAYFIAENHKSAIFEFCVF